MERLVEVCFCTKLINYVNMAKINRKPCHYKPPNETGSKYIKIIEKLREIMQRQNSKVHCKFDVKSIRCFWYFYEFFLCFHAFMRRDYNLNLNLNLKIAAKLPRKTFFSHKRAFIGFSSWGSPYLCSTCLFGRIFRRRSNFFEDILIENLNNERCYWNFWLSNGWKLLRMKQIFYWKIIYCWSRQHLFFSKEQRELYNNKMYS